MNYIVYYILIGMIWTAWLDFVVQPRAEAKPMNNFNRIANMSLWIVILIIFISVMIKRYINRDEE